MTKTDQEFIPALGLRALTPFYDLIQRWVVRDVRFKSRLIERAKVQAGQRVLDLGCGTGTLAIMLQQAQPQAQVTGVDADPQILSISRAKAARLGLAITFDHGMASTLPYDDNTFDRVLSSLVIHHLKTPDKHKAAREVYRVLKPGGQLHVLDFGRQQGLYGRLLTPFLRLFEQANDNVDGRLPSIFREAGLTVAEGEAYMTFFGSLTFLQGEKS